MAAGMTRADAALYHQCRKRGGVVDLSSRVQLLLTGADRVRYLNGQVTHDVRKLLPGQSLAACVTTAKGRLCADVIITAQAETLIVDAEPVLHETLPARLERYIVADDVVIEDATGVQALLHFLGGAAPPCPPHGSVAVARRFGREGWDVRMPRADLPEVQREFGAGRVMIDDALAEVLRIEAGIPRWGWELDENTLPPEAGLEETHIDYQKGCYIGQEVISRLRSVGHVNRRLTGFVAADAAASLEAGMPLFANPADPAPVGILTSAAFSFALDKPIALGYLKRGSPGGGLHARAAGGTHVVVAVQEPPFVS
jgi:folate-binding protein YgfZ